VTFEILGKLQRVSGDVAPFSNLAPRVYIPLAYVDATRLIQPGSRVRYQVHFKLGKEQSLSGIMTRHEEEIRGNRLSIDTVEKRKETLGRTMGNLNRFLTLLGFVALVLGGVGIASAIHLYVRQRFNTIAVLRCVGASPKQTLAIYLVQAAVIGVVGAWMGALLGLLVQQALPLVFSGILPIQAEASISWASLARGMLIGFGVTFLFALIPLAPVRNIPPLMALRSDYEARSHRWDSLVFTAYVFLIVGLLLFSLESAREFGVGLGFFVGVIVVFALLYGVAKLVMFLIRSHFPRSWSYECRQGLANLYRPHNQTVVLLLALGLGTFFLLLLYLTQASLLHELELTRGETRPNLILFDIQTDQKSRVEELLQVEQLPLLQDVPVVTMRLSAVNGRTVHQIRKDLKNETRDWALLREYRSTYRDHLAETEKLVRGSFPDESATDAVSISLEEGIAKELGVSLSDRLVFDVQGVGLETVVGSIRQVDWRNFQPNFFVVFPTGVLEDAPQFHVLVTRADSPQASGHLQRLAVREFPNISAIDLSLVIETIDLILEKVVFVIRFMASFFIATGFVVLTGAIASGRYQRMKESVLLRTLGASRVQVRRIHVVEYLLLGLLAALTGLVLALLGSWMLSVFVFESTFVLAPLPIMSVTSGIVLLTLLIGMFNSLGILDHPPLEVLRLEK
jgi:putative ABC transport system permease protein